MGLLYKINYWFQLMQSSTPVTEPQNVQYHWPCKVLHTLFWPHRLLSICIMYQSSFIHMVLQIIRNMLSNGEKKIIFSVYKCFEAEANRGHLNLTSITFGNERLRNRKQHALSRAKWLWTASGLGKHWTKAWHLWHSDHWWCECCLCPIYVSLL